MSTNFFEWLCQDVRYGVRAAGRSPAFAITACLTLAVGLGLNGALFTVFNTYVLQPIAAQDPQSLYELGWYTKSAPIRGFNREQYEMVRTQSSVLSGVIAFQPVSAKLEGKFVQGTLVSGNFFATLGVKTIVGRPVGDGDALAPGGDRVVVLSHRAWQRLYGSDASVIGRNVLINGQRFTILGVLGPEFTGLYDMPPDFYTPMSMVRFFLPARVDARGRETERYHLVGRLAPGISRERAMSALTVLARNLSTEWPEAQRVVRANLESKATLHVLNPQLIAALSPLLFVFGLILLICCVNVSSMLLARAISRQREIGVRLAIGASRSRLVRQLVSEGLVLGVLGGGVGLAVSLLAIGVSESLVRSNLPAAFAGFALAPLRADGRVTFFILAAATMSVFVFALPPALQATKMDLVSALRGEFSQALRASTLRALLVSTQIAVSVTLVVLTGVLLRSSTSYGKTDLGYDIRGLSSVMVTGGMDRAETGRLIERLKEEPSVESVIAVMATPMSPVRRLSALPAGASAPVEAGYNLVPPEYFQMLRLPILRGRSFTKDEARSEAGVVVISQATASRFWPGQEPIGKVVRIPQGSNAAAPRFDQAVVIGITKDIVSGMVFEGIDATMIYFPSLLEARSSLIPFVRFRAGMNPVRLEEVCASLFPNRLAVALSYEEMLAMQLFPFRAASWVAALLGGIALLLTASAMYGTMGYVVNQRTREIGIRIALGATPGNIVSFFLKYCVRLAAIGLVAGTAISLGLSQLIGNMITMIDTFDPVAYAAGIAVVVMAGLAASHAPIRRVALANSVDSIRQE